MLSLAGGARSAIRRVERSLDELIRRNGYRSARLVSLYVKNDSVDRSECRRFNEDTERLRCGHQRFSIPHSVSELFIALGILNLYRNGHLSLQDKVFGPHGVFNLVSPVKDDRIAEVTIEHLLRHTSGIEELHLRVGDKEKDLQRVFDWVEWASSPGYRYERCRSCYDLLCLVVYRISGIRCGKYISNLVLSPIGFSKIKYVSEKRETSDRFGSWLANPRDLVSLFQFITESDLYSSILLSKPKLPYPQHKDKWPGFGVMVDKNGHVWSESYHEDDDSLILHNVLSKTNATLFISLTENRRKCLKPVVSSVIHQLLSED